MGFFSSVKNAYQGLFGNKQSKPYDGFAHSRQNREFRNDSGRIKKHFIESTVKEYAKDFRNSKPMDWLDRKFYESKLGKQFDAALDGYMKGEKIESANAGSETYMNAMLKSFDNIAGLKNNCVTEYDRKNNRQRVYTFEKGQVPATATARQPAYVPGWKKALAGFLLFTGLTAGVLSGTKLAMGYANTFAMPTKPKTARAVTTQTTATTNAPLGTPMKVSYESTAELQLREIMRTMEKVKTESDVWRQFALEMEGKQSQAAAVNNYPMPDSADNSSDKNPAGESKPTPKQENSGNGIGDEYRENGAVSFSVKSDSWVTPYSSDPNTLPGKYFLHYLYEDRLTGQKSREYIEIPENDVELAEANPVQYLFNKGYISPNAKGKLISGDMEVEFDYSGEELVNDEFPSTEPEYAEQAPSH